jgi:hypothetical protein
VQHPAGARAQGFHHGKQDNTGRAHSDGGISRPRAFRLRQENGRQAGDAAALIGEGWTAYRLSEFQNAALAFEAARASAERGSDDWAMATYGLATTWDLRRPGEDPARHQLYRKSSPPPPTAP